MPLSPPPERVDPMHRQIAGKLTGPVTKWIVLVRLARRPRGSRLLRRQAHRRPEQRGRRPGCPRAPSRPRRSTALEAVPGPQRHPDARRLLPRRPASPRTTSPRSTSRPPRSPSIDGVTERPHARRRRRRPASRAVRLRGRRGRVALLRDLQLRRRRLERHPRRRRRDPRHHGDRRRRRSTSPAPAARPPTRPRRSRASTATCC